MYARIAQFKCVEGKKKDLVQGYKDSMPLLNSQDGLRHVVLMSDPNGDGVISVSIWDTKEQIEESEKPGKYMDEALPYISPYQQQRPNFQHWEVHVLDIFNNDMLDKKST